MEISRPSRFNKYAAEFRGATRSKADAHREKGEYVVLLEGAESGSDAEAAEAERILNILLAECSVKQAANLTAQITGRKKNALYDRALAIKGQAE